MIGPIRFGILSTAHYHANFWAEAVNEIEDAALVGVWDDDSGRGAVAAERYATRYYPVLADLLAACDAVGITSETSLHADLVEVAAAAGVHVLCEKPMATSAADCDRIQAAVRRAGIVYMQNFPKRHDPVNQELVDRVQRGDLGRIALARVRHGHAHGRDASFVGQWFVNPSLSGGGTLIDEGIHAADFLLWLLGNPVSVSATISNRLLNLPVEDTALALVTFASGAIAEICTSWSFHAAEQSVEVYGAEGAALLSGVDLASKPFAKLPYLRVYQSSSCTGVWDGSATTPNFVSGNFHQAGPRHFIHCLRTGAAPPVDAAVGRHSVDLILAAYAAARTGQAQALSLTHGKVSLI